MTDHIEEDARGHLRIEGTWLVSEVDLADHACECGHYGAHEPGCGLIPEVDLATLPGWGDLLATARTSPTHAQAMETIALHMGWQPGLIEAADAVMALYGQQPTEAEAGARALEQAALELSDHPEDGVEYEIHMTADLIDMPGHPHVGDCEGTLCPDCGCCWHKRTCDADCCHNRDCGCWSL